MWNSCGSIILTLFSPAKINLGLWIVGKLSDGYHRIFTVYQKIDLFDKIKIFKTTEKRFILISDIKKQNLIEKVYKNLKSYIKKEIGVGVILEKKIPVGAGLGGGSSNAGIFLNFLNKFFNLGLNISQLFEIGKKIGADVNFFIKPYSSALAWNKGEKLDFFQPKFKYHVLIYKPNFSISTKWAYNEFSKKNLYTDEFYAFKMAFSLKEALIKGEDFTKFMENDFEKIIFLKYPELDKIREQLYKLGAVKVLLSGSGSAIYGIFENEPKNFPKEFIKARFL